MTDGRLPLAELLQKAGDEDFLRHVAEAVVQLLMETDVDGLIGGGRHERSGERTTYRNGYRDRRRCQVEGRGDAEGLVADQGLCGSGNAGDLAPGAKSGGAGRPVIGGGEAMAADLEVVMNRPSAERKRRA